MSTKISALTDGTTAAGTDKIPVERSGTNRYITPAYIAAYLISAGKLGLIARAHNSSGARTFTNGSDTTINFDTVDYDPLTTITTGASWHFTVPATGRYNVVLVDPLVSPEGAAYTTSNGVSIETFVGGSYVNELGYEESDGTGGATNHWLFPNGSGSLSLTATNIVDFRFDNFSGATRRLATGAAIEIYRVA